MEVSSCFNSVNVLAAGGATLMLKVRMRLVASSWLEVVPVELAAQGPCCMMAWVGHGNEAMQHAGPMTRHSSTRAVVFNFQHLSSTRAGMWHVKKCPRLCVHEYRGVAVWFQGMGAGSLRSWTHGPPSFFCFESLRTPDTPDPPLLALYCFHRADMTRDEAESFVVEALALAMARDASSGGVIRTVTLDSSGATER